MSKESKSFEKTIFGKFFKIIGSKFQNETELWLWKRIFVELEFYAKILGSLLFIALLSHFICNHYDLFLKTNDSTMHYLLSSLIQADAAIVSIVIVVIIFRRQFLDQEIEKVKTIFRFDFSSAGWWNIIRDFEKLSFTRKMKSLENLESGKEKQLKEQWINVERNKVETAIHFSLLIIISLITMMLLIWLLPFSITLHENIKSEQLWISLTLVVQFTLFASIARSIFKMFMVI